MALAIATAALLIKQSVRASRNQASPATSGPGVGEAAALGGPGVWESGPLGSESGCLGVGPAPMAAHLAIVSLQTVWGLSPKLGAPRRQE